MTHSEAINGNRSGLEPTRCGGELVPLSSHSDVVFEEGHVRDRQVDVYRCDACGRRVSMVGRQALNDYQFEPVGAIVRALSNAWDVKPMLPAPTEEL